jgi:hypothetical protein
MASTSQHVWPETETSPNDGGMVKISLMEFWWIERNSNQ